MRRRELRRVFDAARQITARRCDIFVPPYTCITEDDGKGPWEPCDPCLLAQAGVPLPECTATEYMGGTAGGSAYGHVGSCPLHPGSTPDPRFLAGETAVLTDASEMALVVAIGWDGAADIMAKIDKPTAAKHLRHIADQWAPDPELDHWKAIAAKLAYLVAKRDCPHATEEEVEKIASGMLAKAMEIERNA